MGNRKHPLRCADNQNVAPFMVKHSREDVILRRAARAIVERLAAGLSNQMEGLCNALICEEENEDEGR